MKTKVLILILLVAGVSLAEWTIKLVPHIVYEADEVIWDDLFYFGTRVGATDDLDIGIDVHYPPFPPAGPRFFFPSTLTNLCEDYRSVDNDTIMWEIVFDYLHHEGSPEPESLYFTWDTISVPDEGDYRIMVVPDPDTSSFKSLSSLDWDSSINMNTDDNIPYLPSNYLVDKIAIRMTSVSSVEEDNLQPESVEINVYPNPFNSACQIDHPKNTIVRIYDVKGQIVSVLNSNENVWTPSANIDSGIFLARIENSTDERGKAKRIIYIK